MQQQLVPPKTRGVRGAEAVNQIGDRLEGIIGKPQRHQDVDCAAFSGILCNQRTEKSKYLKKPKTVIEAAMPHPSQKAARTFAIGTEQFAQKVHAGGIKDDDCRKYGANMVEPAHTGSQKQQVLDGRVFRKAPVNRQEDDKNSANSTDSSGINHPWDKNRR